MFRFFRRYQKSIIVVGGVILMFVFLVGDYLGSYWGNAGTGRQISPRATFATWNGGKLTHGEYETEYNRRRILDAFLKNVYVMGQQRALARGIEQPELAVTPVGLLDESLSPEQVRRTVVVDHVLAEQARDRGMRISRETLENYIARLGHSELTASDTRAALSAIHGAVSADFVLDALEDAFLARMMRTMYGANSTHMLMAEMPLDRWRTWRQVNDRVIVEAAALKVEDFESQVPAPTDQQLRELYDEFKDVEPRPQSVDGVILPSPDPGFAVPRRVKLQYLQADYNAAMEKLKSEVTDEEVKEYYEQNKGLFRKAQSVDLFSPLTDPDQPAPETEAAEGESPEGEAPETEAPNTEAPETEAPESEERADEAPGESGSEGPVSEEPADSAPQPEAMEEADTPSATDEAPSTPASEEPQEAASEPPVTEEPATEQPAAETPPAEQPEQPQAEEPQAEEPQAASALTDSVHFVSYQPDDQQPDDQQPGDQQPGEQAPPAEEPAADEPAEPATEEAPAETTAETNEATEEPQPESEAAPETNEESTPETESPDGEQPADNAEAEQDEYQPLEEVEDSIRTEIARPLFEAQVDAALEKAMVRLQLSAKEYRREILALPEDAPLPEPPAELTDLSALASEFSMNAEETVELSVYELSQTDVGMAFDENFRLVWQAVFGSSTGDLYRPFSARAVGQEGFGDRYIIMKTADLPRRVPPFDEVKSEVRKAWVKREAAKLAQTRAEEFASKASEAGQTLAEFFAGDENVEVTETVSFTWYTPGEAASPEAGPNYQMSQPHGVTKVGPDFMETVFRLRGGEMGGVLNHDHSIAYVVRVADEIETEESLRDTFLANANAWDGRLVFRNLIFQERMESIYVALQEQLDIELPGLEDLERARDED